MKKSSILVMMIAFVMGSVACACGDVAIDTENFPDEDFRVFVSRYDIGDRGYKGYKDGIFSNEELQKVTEILCDHLNIVDLKGIEFFTALKHLDCSGNQITTLDVSKNADLTILRCSSNLLTSLDLRGCVTLEHLDCSQNYLSTLDLSKNVALTLIYCEDNELTVLNLEEYTELTRLNCTNNRLHSLNVEGCIDLTYLSCYHNQLTTLNVNGCNNLQHIDCQYNQLVTLNVDECNALYWLVCHDNRLQRLDMSNCTAIAELWCNDNQLVTLDVSNNPSLTTLHCENNLLTLLNLNNCQNLRNIYCDNEVKIIRSTTDKPTITTDILPTATKDQLYSLQLTATGSYPITWSLKSGKLPPNIILSESGLISGTPTKVAKYTFTVKASNSEGEDLKELTLAVSASSPITITTTSLKVGTINKSYNVTLKANGTKPLTWSAEGLPSGLTCSEKGKISGKPTAFGTFNVNFTVSNGAGSTIRELQLTIKGIPPKLSGSLAKGDSVCPTPPA